MKSTVAKYATVHNQLLQNMQHVQKAHKNYDNCTTTSKIFRKCEAT